MTVILAFLWSLLSSGSTILYGILTAAGAVAAAWAMGKRSGTKEEQQRARIDQLERTNEAVQERSRINQAVRDMDDSELERLRVQYERPELASELRGVGGDQDEQDGPIVQKDI